MRSPATVPKSAAADERTAWPRVAVVGAGLGGLAAAVKLRLAGVTRVSVFEASSGPGGTWWTNRYPGCEVDTASQAYSFSFISYPWPGSHADRRELIRYAETIIDHFGLRESIRFDCRVERAVWSEERRCYTVLLESGEEQEFDILVSAVGMFSRPNIPRWSRSEEFRGEVFHSSQWPEDLDLTGKRVAVVGTGSTSVQVVPEIAAEAEHVTVFQREPGWILPKPTVTFGEAERHVRIRQRLRERVRRALVFRRYAQAVETFQVGSKRHRKFTEDALQYLDEAVSDDRIRKLLTPTYPYGCKRVVKASGFYEAFDRDDVELIPAAVETLTATGLRDVEGRDHPADVVVLATGYQATEYLATLPVVGADGRALHDVWAGDPQAYLGITVPGFPNLFIMYGPNTNGGGPITAQHERQAEFLVRAIRRARRRARSVIDTRRASMAKFVSVVDEQNAVMQSAAESGCHNYYKSAAGRNVTQWPSSHLRYLWRVRRGLNGLRFRG